MNKIIIIALFFTLYFLSAKPAFAQLRTNSNVFETRVGNPIVSDSALAQVAAALANTVKNACGGFLRGSNINCLDGLSLPGVPSPDVAIGELVKSANANGCDTAPGTCLQCVGFVQAAVGGAFGVPLDKGGNAKDYATNVPTGYQYIPLSSGTPLQEGDIIIKTGGPYGHIAIVTNILDSSLIMVAEGNYGTNGEVDVNNSVSWLWSGFLRKL